MNNQAKQVIDFWRAAGPKKWFAKDDDFDLEFKQKFYELHFTAASQELESWLDQADSALALIILLDQYPRNSFRNTAHMFACDGLALAYARKALVHLPNIDKELRGFICLPFMHSEDLSVQDESVLLYVNHVPESLRWAQIHRDIIAKYGRFPHRNAVLGRQTTPEEQQFLDAGGFAG